MIDKSVSVVRVYYGDGSTFDITNTTNFNLVPTTNVQAVSIKYVDGTARTMHGNDFYWRRRNNNDDFGQGDSPPSPANSYYVLTGTAINAATYVTILRSSLEWLGVAQAQTVGVIA